MSGMSYDVDDVLGSHRPANASRKWAIFPCRMLSRIFSLMLRTYPRSNGNVCVFIDSISINAITYTTQSCPLKLKSCNCKTEGRAISVHEQLTYRLLVLLGALSVLNFSGYALCVSRWMHQRKAKRNFLHTDINMSNQRNSTTLCYRTSHHIL